jgi:hypothetical protein
MKNWQAHHVNALPILRQAQNGEIDFMRQGPLVFDAVVVAGIEIADEHRRAALVDHLRHQRRSRPHHAHHNDRFLHDFKYN